MRVTCLVLLSILVLCAARPAAAATGVTVKPAQGTPDTVVTVTGSGFAASEAVDVYVDVTDTVLLVSSSTGGISASITIPIAATPGGHYITAIGRRSGDTAQAAFNVTTPWVEFGYGSAHLAFNPWENSIGASNAARLGTLWTHTETAGASGATPAVIGGVVYVSTLGGVEALSAATGATVWKSYSTLSFYASPTVVGGVVYIASGSTGAMYALNAKTGAKIWSTSLGGVAYSSATVAGGLVYVGCLDGKVYALSASTGKITWTYQTGTFFGTGIDATPTVVNGVVYVGTFDQYVYALNAATGAKIWSYQTSAGIDSTAAVVNGFAYVGGQDGTFYAFSALNGGNLWFAGDGVDVTASPAVANGVVYVGTDRGVMYAFNAYTGATIWSLSVGSAPQSAAVANGVVYFTALNMLYAVDATNGAILYEFNAFFSADAAQFFGSPAVSDGVVYISSDGGNTYAFSLTVNADPAIRRGPPLASSLHPDLRLPISH